MPCAGSRSRWNRKSSTPESPSLTVVSKQNRIPLTGVISIGFHKVQEPSTK